MEDFSAKKRTRFLDFQPRNEHSGSNFHFGTSGCSSLSRFAAGNRDKKVAKWKLGPAMSVPRPRESR
eukprot:1195597-Prorocentrum_minimum.AAC.5